MTLRGNVTVLLDNVTFFDQGFRMPRFEVTRNVTLMSLSGRDSARDSMMDSVRELRGNSTWDSV